MDWGGDAVQYTVLSTGYQPNVWLHMELLNDGRIHITNNELFLARTKYDCGSFASQDTTGRNVRDKSSEQFN
jgi:hypothetical protein